MSKRANSGASQLLFTNFPLFSSETKLMYGNTAFALSYRKSEETLRKLREENFTGAKLFPQKFLSVFWTWNDSLGKTEIGF